MTTADLKAGVKANSSAGFRADVTTPPVRDANCLNCGAEMTGPFCANCGQRAIPAYPTVEELASDAFHEVSGWDGRFATTFRTLIRRPGELTREFLIGHRARYISPIRLYLVTSLLYFLAAAAAPNVDRNSTVTEVGALRVGIFTPRTGRQPAQGELTPEERAEALKSIESSPALIRPIVRRAFEDPQGFRSSILTTMPRALFLLVPVFAGILALFYRKRHYPEHLYFAFHLHSFMFLALTASAVAKMSQVVPLVITAQLAVFVAIVLYSTKALRQVYGGSLLRTLAKGVGTVTLYVLAAFPVLLGMLAWAALS